MSVNRRGKDLTARLAKLVSDRRFLIAVAEKGELLARTLQSKGLDTSLREQVRSVRSILPISHAVVFDVGANVGDWTRELLQEAGDAIDAVHCFEPANANVAAIRRHLTDSRVVVHAFAAGSRAGTRQFYSDYPGSTIASFFTLGTPDAPVVRHSEKVRVRPLDDVIKERQIPQVDLVKMDIEGAELEALEGLRYSVGKGVVKAFTFECGPYNVASRTFFHDYFKFSTENGFRVYRLTAGGGLFEVRDYRFYYECFGVTNYLSTRVIPRF